MTNDRAFRIHSVTIEGFKAFTTPQTFVFEGRNIFLFGPNGFGKTSIVEAIRWCLFGQSSRQGQDEVIRNQFYVGKPCVVQMELLAPDGLWTWHRRLRPTGNLSDLTIRDPKGLERNLEDVFPQLSRIGPREGTHVIYAAQQPSSRRPEADITDFSYIVYRYLGLEEIPRLSAALSAISNEWVSQEEEVCRQIEELGDLFSKRISEVDGNLSRIMANPPWGDDVTPNNDATRQKVDWLIDDAERLGAQCSRDALEDLSLQDKVNDLDAAVGDFFEGALTEFEEELQRRSRLYDAGESTLKRATTATDEIRNISLTVQELQGEQESALGASSLDELEHSLKETEEGFEASQSKLNVVRSALQYFEVAEDESGHENCPSCNTQFQSGELRAQLLGWESSGDKATNDLLDRRDALRERISAAKRFADQIQANQKQITKHHGDLVAALEHGQDAFGLPSPATLDSLQGYVEETRKSCEELGHALGSREEAYNDWKTRIDNIRREVQFRRFLNQKTRLQRLYDREYAALHDNLKEMSDLRNIVDETRGLLNSHLRDRLQNDLPPVGEEMTEVYLRLTGNPTFDSISIRQGGDADDPITLEMRVSSTHGSGNWGVGQGVLNGQAQNAIGLVPYFVFSRYQDSPLLDLLLLDDPTQAFDNDKVNLLLKELSGATAHAHLFVATHEEDKFLSVLKDHFVTDDIKAYRALGIGANGPVFEDVPIPI